MNTFKAIQDNVVSSYVDNKPLHHLDAAHSLEFDPNGSSIFVVDHETFNKMDPSVIQNIFRERHILVTRVPHEEQEFDEDSLLVFGDIDCPREITGVLFFFIQQIILIIISFHQSHPCVRRNTLMLASSGEHCEIWQ